MRILQLIVSSSDLYYDFYIQKRNTDVINIYRVKNRFLLLLRYLHYKSHLPFFEIWYNRNWINELPKYDVVLLFDSYLTLPIVDYLSNRNIKVIYWFWNRVYNVVSIPQNNYCEKWSYDPLDCKKYGLKYNTQFYFNNIVLPEKKIKYDLFFVGKDKGRYEILCWINSVFEKYGLKTFIYLTDKKRFGKRNEKYREAIPYEKVLEYVSECRAILDIVPEDQYGLTLRPLEALFFQKKLITCQRNIMNYDFYNENNIRLVDSIDSYDIIEFITSPYSPIAKDIVDKYDYSNWIKRFF